MDDDHDKEISATVGLNDRRQATGNRRQTPVARKTAAVLRTRGSDTERSLVVPGHLLPRFVLRLREHGRPF